jgi:simple sugar transport system ATP-binding protein
VSPALQLEGIHKRFGDTVALDGASVAFAAGSVHALLGENGAGKTTLMRVAHGLLAPDAGVVSVRGKVAVALSPRVAAALGIGMVHQHFTLVPALTVLENVALGIAGRRRRGLDRRIRELSRSLGLAVDPQARVRDLSVATQQRVEILKALARDATILILDEPTAVLAPSETDSLLTWLRAFADAGNCVALITHKLREARAFADTFTVLRHGRVIVSGPADAFDDQALVAAMVGSASGVLDARVRREAPPSAQVGTTVLTLRSVSLERDHRRVLSDVTLDVRSGEILGVAGVEGSGQRELLRIVAGRHEPSAGVVSPPSADVAFIPDDRQADAIILEMSLTENAALRGLRDRRWLMPWRDIGESTRAMLRSFDVRAESADTPIATLSGGNQQKFVVAREFSPRPPIIVAENPTRGLDVVASDAVHAELRAARDDGRAVVLYSPDLDEILELSDRIVAVYGGRLREVRNDRAAVGRAILGISE